MSTHRVQKEKRQIKLVALNARFSHSCLALFYLREALAEHDPKAQTEIVQLTINDNYHEMLLQITADHPYAVFLSAAIWNSTCIEQLATDIRACLPRCLIVIGGPQAGVLRRRLAEEVCSVVIGEIEAVPERFYRDLAAGSLQPCYTGSFLRSKPSRLAYPYRDSDFHGPLANRSIYYESSRGCPYSCTYCLSAAEKGLFHKDLEQVREELQHILSFQPKVVRFVDRTFNDLPRRALSIWRFLAEQQTETVFHFEIAPEKFSEEMFAFLETVPVGRFQFEIGIQSTHATTLAAIRRPIDVAQTHIVVQRLARAANIHLHADLILGLPYETVDSFSASFAAVFAMEPHYIQMGLLKILPDTPISREAPGFAYRFCAEPPYSVLANKWLDHRTMTQLYWLGECVEKFYNNRFFVSVWHYLRNSEEDIVQFFQRLQDICHQEGFFRRAATQELMCRMLVRLFAKRADRSLVLDLLRYDWLRCGHRALPDCLMIPVEEEQPGATRDLLYGGLPERIDGVFGPRERNRFFKRSVCLRIGAAAAEALGIEAGNKGRRLCFSQEREKTLYGHNRLLLLDHYMT